MYEWKTPIYDAADAERDERHWAARRRDHFLDDIWDGIKQPAIALRLAALGAVAAYGVYLVSDIDSPTKTPSATCTESTSPACKP